MTSAIAQQVSAVKALGGETATREGYFRYQQQLALLRRNARIAELGLDLNRLRWVRWMVQTGRITDQNA